MRMPLILKRKKIKPDTFAMCDNFAPISFREYHDKLSSYTATQIRRMYKLVFNRECTCNIVWAKYQISYELARQDDIKTGMIDRLKPGSPFRLAYAGTMQCDVHRTGPTLRTLIPYELKNYDENSVENIMKKEAKIKSIKKAAEAKAANRVGITLQKSVPETWVYVFKSQPKNKWTDEKISEFMHKEFPDLKNKAFDQIVGCRNHYNNGGYTKGVKPVVKVVRYDSDGNVVKRAIKTEPQAKAAPAKNTVAKKAVLAVKKAIKPAVKLKKAATGKAAA